MLVKIGGEELLRLLPFLKISLIPLASGPILILQALLKAKLLKEFILLDALDLEPLL
jgi:hypothetical protein